ncbi:MAG: NUMOD4 motif-containing HNH endonuclease [Ignavibacteria bacterium]|nr:NUMOD4 motif-containing HNH endonuclease [Ignavibacteria bacterium]
MQNEIWKDIPDYEGIYKASNLGNIKSLKNKKEKILSPAINDKGYYKVVLYKNKIKKTKLGHRLVAIAFIPNPENKPEVNHKDGNPLNNNIDNLEWNTKLENVRHAFRTGLVNHKGENNSRHKLTKEDVILIRKLKKEYKIKSKTIADLFNIKIHTFYQIIYYKRWSFI